MNKSGWVRHTLVALFGVVSLQGLAAHADQATPARPPLGSAAARERGFDWIEHTQHTLDELKAKLNLTSGQTAAWDSWAGGVLKDARQQLEQKKSALEQKKLGEKSPDDVTTPERMARGIEHLRAQTKWMEEHLTQLEAAQIRTKNFYDALDKNQKTIFDLYWHEVHHRAAGHDGAGGMHEHEGFGPGPMREHEGPGAGY